MFTRLFNYPPPPHPYNLRLQRTHRGVGHSVAVETNQLNRLIASMVLGGLNPNPNLFVGILKMLEKKLNSSGVCGFAMLRLFVAINGLVGY